MTNVLADRYKHAEQFLSWNALFRTQNTILKIQWLNDGKKCWYIVSRKGGYEFWGYDCEQRKKAILFDHERIAAILSKVLHHSISSTQLPFFHIDLFENETLMRVTIQSHIFQIDLQRYEVELLPPKMVRSESYEVLSPNEQWAAYLKDNNLWIREIESNSTHALTFDGEQYFSYGTDVEDNDLTLRKRRAKQQDPPIVVWSPDSSKLFTIRIDLRDVKTYAFYQACSIENPPLPEVHPIKFRLPTDSTIPIGRGYIFDLTSDTCTQIAYSFPIPNFNPAAYHCAWWDETSTTIYIFIQERYFQTVKLLAIDAVIGSVREVFHETNKSFIDFHFNNPIAFFPQKSALILDHSFLWWSQKSNWGHLYLVDLQTGQFHQLTQGQWNVREVLYVDPINHLIYFIGNGRETDCDPYYRRLYRLDLTTSQIYLLTPEPVDHEIHCEPPFHYFLDIASEIQSVPHALIRDRDGTFIEELEIGDVSLLQSQGWQWPEPFQSISADGQWTIHGALFKPTDFDPTLKYPVIDYVYCGPQKIHTPKSFPTVFDIESFHVYWSAMALSQLGFIVMTCDGRGTPYRSKSFHDSCYHDLAGDQALADHVTAICDLGSRYSWFDTKHVGVFGHSAGGYAAARAILTHPEVFKVAVSSAAVSDQVMDQIAWIECFLGPYDQALYEQQSLYPLAPNLSGNLLLVAGELDENVPLSNLMRFIRELIHHNKDFDLIIFPDQDHWYMIHPYFIRKYWDYFVRHLIGQDPPYYSITPLDPRLLALFTNPLN